MARFGSIWEQHTEKIINGWSCVNNDDIVIIAGDISWCSNIIKAKADFDFIESLPGKKIITIGNHDFWHQSATKTNDYFYSNYKSMVLLSSNDYFNLHDSIAICSVKGYMNETHPEFKSVFRKGYDKECVKLENTLKIIPSIFTSRILVSHYPPIHKLYKKGNNEVLNIMQTYGITKCIYGHLHGDEVAEKFEGLIKGINFIFVACDSHNFIPRLIYEI